MATLEAVLTAPKKQRSTTSPEQKVLKKLARQGWGENARGTKTVLCRQYGDELFMTNTFMMRRWAMHDDVAVAVRSTVPEHHVNVHSVEQTLVDGFELSLTVSQGGSFLVGSAPDMMGVWPTQVPSDEVVSWEQYEDDPKLVCGVTEGGARVLLNAKFLSACTDGITNPRVWVTVETDGDVRKPVVVTGDYGLWVYSILMPRRF